MAVGQEAAQLLQVCRVEGVFEHRHELRREAAVAREVFFVNVGGRGFSFEEDDGDGFGSDGRWGGGVGRIAHGGGRAWWAYLP